MKTPITYYGGKQRMAPIILEMIPPHVLYAEPFCGGAAIFFSKKPSQVEVLNDTNGELINFYKVIKEQFEKLYQEVSVTLHSRKQHKHAWIIYNNPDMFDEIKRAWALWIFFSRICRAAGGWGLGIRQISRQHFEKNLFQ